MAGFVAGIVRLVLIFVYPAPSECGEEDNRLDFISVHFILNYIIFLFYLS